VAAEGDILAYAREHRLAPGRTSVTTTAAAEGWGGRIGLHGRARGEDG
jgi:hypothetical protein